MVTHRTGMTGMRVEWLSAQNAYRASVRSSQHSDNDGWTKRSTSSVCAGPEVDTKPCLSRSHHYELEAQSHGRVATSMVLIDVAALSLGILLVWHVCLI